MAFFIRGDRRIWCGDLWWRAYERRPSVLTLRREALSLGAHYTVRSRALPGLIGFLAAEKLDPREPFHSLMVAIAEKYGPRYYGEYEVGIDQIWVIATDDEGRPLPGSDGVYSEEAVEAVRTGFEGFVFERRDLLSIEQFEALQADLPDAPLVVRSISLRPYYLAGALALALLLVAGEGLHLYRLHQTEVARQLAREALLRSQQRLARAQAPREIPPGEWVDACIAAVPEATFVHGWVMAQLVCHDDTLLVTWTRRGGALSDAPSGDIVRNGEAVESPIPLRYAPSRSMPADPAFGERALFGILQTAGVASQINRTTITLMVGNRKVPTLNTHAVFNWPGTPRDLPWDRFSGLRVIEMKRTVLADQASPGGWQFRVTFSHPLLPTPKQERHS